MPIFNVNNIQLNRLKRIFAVHVKKTMDKAKSIAQEVSHARHREDVADIIDEVRGEQNIKLKASNSHKGPYDFDGSIRHVQVWKKIIYIFYFDAQICIDINIFG